MNTNLKPKMKQKSGSTADLQKKQCIVTGTRRSVRAWCDIAYKYFIIYSQTDLKSLKIKSILWAF